MMQWYDESIYWPRDGGQLQQLPMSCEMGCPGHLDHPRVDHHLGVDLGQRWVGYCLNKSLLSVESLSLGSPSS